MSDVEVYENFSDLVIHRVVVVGLVLQHDLVMDHGSPTTVEH